MFRVLVALLLLAWPASAAMVETHNVSAAGVQATTTVAAQAGVSYRPCAITAVVAQDATGVSGIATVNLRDSTTGAGTILWTAVVSAAASSSAGVVVRGVGIPGTPGNAMTLEFAAGASNSGVESVSLIFARNASCDP